MPEFVEITIIDGSQRIPHKVPMHASCAEKIKDFLRAYEKVVDEEGEEEYAEIQ
jgi:hypothetical protein